MQLLQLLRTEDTLRIHILFAIIGTVAALTLASVVVPPAEATFAEVCCNTMGECPGGYRCCEGSGEPCAGQAEGYCRLSCLPRPHTR